MSNLKNSFDVLRGWPKGGAVDENYAPNAGVTFKEGLLAQIDPTTGNLKLATAVAAQTGAVPTKLRMVIQGNDQSDANFVGRVTTLRGAFTVATDQFVTTGFVPGDLVTASVAVDANQGKLKKTTGTEQVLGEVESYDSVNAILTVSMFL